MSTLQRPLSRFQARITIFILLALTITDCSSIALYIAATSETNLYLRQNAIFNIHKIVSSKINLRVGSVCLKPCKINFYNSTVFYWLLNISLFGLNFPAYSTLHMYLLCRAVLISVLEKMSECCHSCGAHYSLL